LTISKMFWLRICFSLLELLLFFSASSFLLFYLRGSRKLIVSFCLISGCISQRQHVSTPFVKEVSIQPQYTCLWYSLWFQHKNDVCAQLNEYSSVLYDRKHICLGLTLKHRSLSLTLKSNIQRCGCYWLLLSMKFFYGWEMCI